RFEVLLGRSDGDVGDGVAGLLQEVQMAEGVAGFRLGRVAKEPADVGISLDVGATSKVEIPAVRLGLTSKRRLQIPAGFFTPQRLRHVIASRARPWRSRSPPLKRTLPDGRTAPRCPPR